jgi:hypothetical protein
MAVKIQPKCPRVVEVLAWVISRVIFLGAQARPLLADAQKRRPPGWSPHNKKQKKLQKKSSSDWLLRLLICKGMSSQVHGKVHIAEFKPARSTFLKSNDWPSGCFWKQPQHCSVFSTKLDSCQFWTKTIKISESRVRQGCTNFYTKHVSMTRAAAWVRSSAETGNKHRSSLNEAR